MNNQTTHLDFSAILAASIHDMKNSLGTMMGLIEAQLYNQEPPYDPDTVQMEFEANRLNNNLMQLLVLYKIESKRFMLRLDEYPATELLEDIVAQNQPFLIGKGIDLTVGCEDDIFVYCDYDLICNVINSLLNNAVRYTKQRIRLTARKKNAYCILLIEDDGEGYPDAILDRAFLGQSGIDFQTGNTGLGLFFASHVAALHKDNGNKGYIDLANGGAYGGACFSLFLP